MLKGHGQHLNLNNTGVGEQQVVPVNVTWAGTRGDGVALTNPCQRQSAGCTVANPHTCQVAFSIETAVQGYFFCVKLNPG